MLMLFYSTYKERRIKKLQVMKDLCVVNIYYMGQNWNQNTSKHQLSYKYPIQYKFGSKYVHPSTNLDKLD